MHKRILATAVLAALGTQNNLMAASLEDRLANTEQRMSYLETRISKQDTIGCLSLHSGNLA